MVGGTAVSLVVVSRTANSRSVTASTPSTITPLTRPMVSAAATTQPTARAARAPIHRCNRPATHRYPARTPRPAATNATNDPAANTGSHSREPRPSGAAPVNSRIWPCHRCPNRYDTTVIAGAAIQKIRHDSLRGGRGGRSANSRQIQAPNTPRP